MLYNVVNAQLLGPDYLTDTHIKQYLIKTAYRVRKSIVTNDTLAMGLGVDRDLSGTNRLLSYISPRSLTDCDKGLISRSLILSLIRHGTGSITLVSKTSSSDLQTSPRAFGAKRVV